MKEYNKRHWVRSQFSSLKGYISYPEKNYGSQTEVLVMLHGITSNAERLKPYGAVLNPEAILISLEAPIVLSTDSFAWFSLDFSKEGSFHHWDEAKKSLASLEKLFDEIADEFKIPHHQISLFGFSQGAIMTLGLLFGGKKNLKAYYVYAGTILPEFLEMGRAAQTSTLKRRPVFLGHGALDRVLPVHLAHVTAAFLNSLGADYIFKSYPVNHDVSWDFIEDAKIWQSKLKLNTPEINP
jgi:phospholipase/carboxylesterase